MSTGISLPMAIASSSVNVLQVAAEGAAAITTGDTILMFIWFIFAVSTISVFFFQIALYAKVDWVWTSWFRASFTRRRATHRERRSAREDARFTWPMRGTVRVTVDSSRTNKALTLVDLSVRSLPFFSLSKYSNNTANCHP